MSTLKTLTSAVTAVALVAGIGLAYAQSEDQPAVDPKPAMPLASEQTPADSSAATAQPSDTAQQPADDPAKAAPPIDSSQQTQPATPPTDSYAKPAQDSSMPAAPATEQPRSEPKPKADRN